MHFLDAGFGASKQQKFQQQLYLQVKYKFPKSLGMFLGVGEHIIINTAARSVVDYMTNSVDYKDQNEFLAKLYHSHSEIGLSEFGFVSVLLHEGNLIGEYLITNYSKDKLEIFTSHSTPSFIYGWKLGKEQCHIEISRLLNEKIKSFATCLRIKV